MYCKALARVKLNSFHATESFKCKKGVRQGCNLSPLLFNLFLRGLEVQLAKNQAGVPLGEATLDTLMFADDIILPSTSADGLKKHIKTLEYFCNEWNLTINTDKTKTCTFGTRKYNQFICGGTPIENVDSYKYLGVWMSRNGRFNKTLSVFKLRELCLGSKEFSPS